MKAKEKIMTATRDLIYQKGYHETSIRDILAASDTGKGQFYYYFDSKKAVCLAVIRSHMEEWQTELFDGILSADIPAKEALGQMLDWIYDSHKEQEIYYGCPVGNLIIELSVVDEDFRALLLELVSEWSSQIKQRILELADHELTEEEAKVKANAMIAEIQGSILLLKVTQDLSILENNFQMIRTNL
ncbi:TetR/AcrR family transcriptional regulator [Enterococcus sp. ZJ1668]|uniref:TetR/AcrR family transcriptional regulator n=1 Tax=Enterococcus sp. ZJ1668 TaxID=2709402 RepID=UPI0013E9ACCF|nr:TetR/AcrR family transcriptional regulator [Enterococcus sp. ZJ1668]